MSQERRTSKADPAGNIARAAQARAAWNAGDFDGFISYYHEHVVMHHPPGWPEPGPSFGIDAVREQFRRAFDVGFGGGGRGLERVGEPLAVGDRVIGRTRLQMEVEGVEIVTQLTTVNTWRDGKVIVVEYFRDHDEALEAVGLSE